MKKCIAIVLLFYSSVMFADQIGTVLYTLNTVHASQHDKDRIINRSSPLDSGDVIITDAIAKAIIKYMNETVVSINENSNYQVSPPDSKSTSLYNATLNKGSIKYSSTGTEKQGVLHTPVVALAILGTEFTATLEFNRPPPILKICVSKGLVQLECPGDQGKIIEAGKCAVIQSCKKVSVTDNPNGQSHEGNTYSGNGLAKKTDVLAKPKNGKARKEGCKDNSSAAQHMGNDSPPKVAGQFTDTIFNQNQGLGSKEMGILQAYAMGSENQALRQTQKVLGAENLEQQQPKVSAFGFSPAVIFGSTNVKGGQIMFATASDQFLGSSGVQDRAAFYRALAFPGYPIGSNNTHSSAAWAGANFDMPLSPLGSARRMTFGLDLSVLARPGFSDTASVVYLTAPFTTGTGKYYQGTATVVAKSGTQSITLVGVKLNNAFSTSWSLSTAAGYAAQVGNRSYEYAARDPLIPSTSATTDSILTVSQGAYFKLMTSYKVTENVSLNLGYVGFFTTRSSQTLPFRMTSRTQSSTTGIAPTGGGTATVGPTSSSTNGLLLSILLKH